MKQVEEEYYKSDEKTAQVPPGNHISTQGSPLGLYARSPERPISAMGQIPEPVKNAVNSIIKSQKTMEHLFVNEMDRNETDRNEIGNEIIEIITSPKPSRYISTDGLLYPDNVDSLGKSTPVQEKEQEKEKENDTPVLSTNTLYKTTDFTV